MRNALTVASLLLFGMIICGAILFGPLIMRDLGDYATAERQAKGLPVSEMPMDGLNQPMQHFFHTPVGTLFLTGLGIFTLVGVVRMVLTNPPPAWLVKELDKLSKDNK
jgi:hypothetical protein